MNIDFSDLRLVWPGGLVRQVAARLAPDDDIEPSTLVWLMVEAFVDPRGFSAMRDGALPGAPSTGSIIALWDGTPSDVCRDYLAALLAGINAGAVKPYTPARYYRRRTEAEAHPSALRDEELAPALCKVIVDLDRRGYFDDAFGSSCSDTRGADRAEVARDIFVEHLGADTPWQWPPAADADVDMEHLYDLVELCYDMVARPSIRNYHSFYEEWDYSDFDRPAGRFVYRWSVNAALSSSQSSLRMSQDAPDEGQLVTTPNDPRAQLPDRVLAASGTAKERDRIEHAITEFRDRHATREAKRDAVIALGAVLELRRTEVKDHLGSKDEGALFEILNNFDIRHLNRTAQGDYEDDFLEWVFWTCLASLAFMNARTGRQRFEES
ncbi:hypothetical protein [Knoellia aerolata]|uniref:Uncharacterized protein n=1 Tax=Knoellia aerolata DSM 18566 TaxID=1385519 RepID=A0A0A0K0H8_9MICO|nr:hypothetical protein [Knoellia aerolata]KGN41837.1 hypothetical protein N801_03925 [Knoellia aerolata DSM 18566]